MASLINSLYYVSPYATPPPGVTVAGVTLQTDPAQSPTPNTITSPVLVIRLRLADSPTVIGVSATSGVGTSTISANYQPAFPLSATESYMIDVMWVTSGTLPENIDWNSAVTSAPVIAAEVALEGASYNGSSVIAKVSYGASSIAVGAQVNVYVLSSGTYVKVGSAQAQGSYVTVPVNAAGYPQVFFINALAVIPTTNAGASGSFAAPFSQGPPTIIGQYSGVPQAAKTLNKATYNGQNLLLSWTLDTVSGCVAPDSSLIEVLASGAVIASFKGGPASASISLDLSGQTNVTVQLSTVYNNIGSVPLSISLITTAPTVKVPTVSGASVTATVTVPAGFSAQAYLMDGDTVIIGPETVVSGNVTFNYATAGMVGLSIVANNCSADMTITGPQSIPAVLLAATPVLSSALIRINPSDATKWLVDVIWDRLPDAAQNVSSYTITLFQGSTSLATQTISGTATSLSIAATDIIPAKEQSITLYATGRSGGHSPTQTLAAIFSPPLLTSLTTTQEQISATWTAPAIPAGNTLPVTYQPVISLNGTTIYSGDSTPSKRGAIPLAGISIPTSGDVIVTVNIALGPVILQTAASMATTCSASPILYAPISRPVTAAALTNLSTLNWTAVSGATAYTINFTDGTQQTNIATNSFKLTNALSPGSQSGYTVQSTGTSNGIPITGPPSALAWVPTNPANVSVVRFNGSTVYASWDAVAEALCYNYSVYDNASPANSAYSGTTNQTFASFTPTTISSSALYTVYVQPVMNTGTGLTGATSNLFTPGIFLSQQPASSAYPYIYAAQNMAALGTTLAGPVAQSIVVYLPELGDAAGALGIAAITVDPFTIEPSGNVALPYKLTIAGDTMAWDFTTSPIRATLQSSYVDFLNKLETPGDDLAGATPYGVSLVQAAIACALPQTFAEQLYYNFGFSTVSTVGAAYIDLRPGMVLRVYASDYISIAQNSLPSWINGYAGATIMDFEIGSYTTSSNWRTGFDGFLNALSAQGALSVSSPATSTGDAQAGLAGAVDLYYPQFVQPFYRLYIPSAISTPWANGSNLTDANFTLVAANSFSDLQGTTVNPSNYPTAYFRGRSIVVVMIKVLVNGNERLVSVGTSIGNLLEQLGMRPSATSPALQQVRIYRSIVPVTNGMQANGPFGSQLELRIDWNGLTIYSNGNGLDSLSAPLLPGDQVFTEQF
jgi:hypothetical protein